MWICTACETEFGRIDDAEEHFITEHGEMSPGEVKTVPRSTYEDGVEAALRVLRSQHFPRQVSAKTLECQRFHDHDKPGAPDYGYNCYEDVSICAGCGTDRCKVLPLVEALLPMPATPHA